MGFNKTYEVNPEEGLLAKGIHVATCTEAELAPIKDGQYAGTEDNLVLTFKPDSKTYTGFPLKTWIPLLPQTEWRVRKALTAFGVKLPEGRGKVKLSDKLFVGKKVRLQIDHGQYQGEPRAEIKGLLHLGDGKNVLAEDEDGPVNAAVNDDDDADLALPF